jgi:hypothetical protein
MSGMKISLDAAMRARDVSPSGWQDDEPPASDEADRPATVGDTTQAGPAASEASDVGATEYNASEPAMSETTAHNSAAGQATGDDQRRRADHPRRHRRRRLRRGRPT